MDKAGELIAEFKINGWQTINLYERLADLTSNTSDAFSFASGYLKAFNKNATIFNDTLSYIEKYQFAELVTLALDTLKRQKNENAESVIEYASLQFPELLHNNLELIFELKPNEKTYFADYPWRNLAADKTEVFKSELVDSKTSIIDQQKLFRCLLETRYLGAITFACNYALNNKLFDNDNLNDYLVAHLELIGYTKRGDKIVSYCPNTPRHFSFNKNYFLKDSAVQNNKWQHPTWSLNGGNTKYKFGGIIQNDDKNPFAHLITFDKIPDGLNVSEMASLTLGMHINELNEYGAVFYRHDEFGKPLKIGDAEKIEDYLDLPIKESEVSFAETPDRWAFQNWGCSNGRENLFRLGGEPTWIQSAEVLTCPLCDEKMDFLMQVDTCLPDTEGGEVYFGSGGICYVFWCDKTKVSGFVMQCT